MYLLDTNVLSEARRGNTQAQNWLRSVDSESIYLSVITLGEIAKGIALKGRSDARAAARLTVWLERLRRDYSDRILPIDDDVALAWGRMTAARPRPMADGLIAATADVHGKIVVTRNIADFADCGVLLINPWGQ